MYIYIYICVKFSEQTWTGLYNFQKFSTFSNCHSDYLSLETNPCEDLKNLLDR